MFIDVTSLAYEVNVVNDEVAIWVSSANGLEDSKLSSLLATEYRGKRLAYLKGSTDAPPIVSLKLPDPERSCGNS